MGIRLGGGIGAAIVLAAALSPALAQSTKDSQPPAKFEVASVKPHDPDDRRELMVAEPGGRFVAVNISLRHLLRTAYQLQDDQIVGGPDWLATDRFDIEARAAGMGAVPSIELLAMLQSLLADRFKLTTHREKREIAVFALERVRRGALGPGLRPTACPELTIDLSQPKPCVNISTGRGSLTLRGMPFAQFTQYLSPSLDRVLIDRTGLDGRYDIELKWSPSQTPEAGAAPPPIGDQDRPALVTAIREQLGLTLQPTRATVEVLVIDSVAQPTAN
jgi:uncharacterized protein (TIGR03435 family)